MCYKRNLFVIDNNELVRNLLKEILNHIDGLDVYVFSDGKEMLLNTVEFQPKIAVIDYNLSEFDPVNTKDGIHLLSQIIKRQPHVNVMMVSALYLPIIREDLIKKGKEQFLGENPKSIIKIQRTIQNLVAI